MSLFGALNTAVSGLTAQSVAFGNISEDVANSQTVGFKRVDTSFADYLTTSTATQNAPGSVVASPEYVNNVQGTITQTDNPLALAIAGQGFFAVSQPTGETKGITTFNPQQYYTQAGDFSMNDSGYLVNSAGQYLNGWTVDPATGIADQNALAPIQVDQSTFNPVATSKVTLAANLPATPAAGTATFASPLSSQVTVYDSVGTAHVINLNWVQNGTNSWTVQAEVPDAASTLGNGTTPNYKDAGAATVSFGNPTSTAPAAGTIASTTPIPGSTVTVAASSGTAGTTETTPTLANGIASWAVTVDNGTTAATTTTYNSTYTTTVATSASSGTAGSSSTAPTETNGVATWTTTTDDGTGSATGTTTTTYTAAQALTGSLTGGGSYSSSATPATAAATLSFVTNFGSGNQTINLDLGSYGQTTGVTQFAGTAYSLLGITQDGDPPGSFSGVSTQTNGNVVVNYNNGQSRTIAQIPLVTFNAPNALQSQNGESFTSTMSSGAALAEAAGTNGAGTFVTGSVEGSNVDIATEFSNLIVAQQAYSSNAKVVTTANTMLQATLQMIA